MIVPRLPSWLLEKARDFAIMRQPGRGGFLGGVDMGMA
jgi:hypothetical protein